METSTENLSNKEKVLALAKACVNNKEFFEIKNYGIGNRDKPKEVKRIEYDYKNGLSTFFVEPVLTYYKGEKVDAKIYPLNLFKIDTGVFYDKSKEFEDVQYSKRTFQNLNIYFEEKPPLEFRVLKKIKDTEKIGEFDVPAIKKIYGTDFWIFTTRDKELKDGVAKYDVIKTIFDIYVEVTFGSLKGEISIDEFFEISEAVCLNEEKFKQEIDQEKLNKKFEEFVKQ